MKQSKGFIHFLFNLLVIVPAMMLAASCSNDTREMIYESPLSQRYPGQEIKSDRVYIDSMVIKIGPIKVPIFIEWTAFTEKKFDCRKVGDIKIYRAADCDARFEDITLTPLPCAVDWFTQDTVISEKILLSAMIEVRENGRKHTFDGNFCSVDGKGRLDNLLD